jgi:hypothetical protein
MIKIAYEILNDQVNKLYPPHYELKANETLDEHLRFIEIFIESCGWGLQEYLDEYIRRGARASESN